MKITPSVRTLLALGVVAGISLGLPASRSLADQSDPVSALVRASGDALGTAALSRLHTVAMSGAANVAGIQGSARTWQDLRDGRFASSIAAGPLSADNGYDGRSVWNRDRTGVVWDDGSRGAYYATLDAAYIGSYGLWKPGYGGARVTLETQQSLAGRAYDVLSVTPRGGLPFDLWIDAATHLPFRTIAPIGTTTTTTTFTNYQTFSGLALALGQKQETDQGATTLAFSEVRFDDVQVPAQLARPQPSVADFSIANGTETSVPMELIDNHVYLDVTLDGKGPYRFGFDTGASLVLDTNLAQSLGLTAAGSVQGSGVGSNTEGFSFATIDSLSIGNARIGKLDAAVAPVRAGFSMAGGKPLDGLIGFETLSRFVTTFDYGKREVIFRLPGSAAVAGGKTSAFTFNGTDPMLPCRIETAAGMCTVDTGSRDAVSVYGPFAKAHPNLAATQTALGIDGFGVGGPALGRLGRLELEMGGFTLPNVIGDVSAQEKGAFADPFLAGNIGGAVWRRFAVTFDYPHSTLTLVPGEEFAAPEQFDRSGLFLLSQNERIVVAGARAGTPAAAAGIAPGEAIVSIDGRATSGMSLKDIRELFMQPAGATHALVVGAKDGTVRNVNLTLRDYV